MVGSEEALEARLLGGLREGQHLGVGHPLLGLAHQRVSHRASVGGYRTIMTDPRAERHMDVGNSAGSPCLHAAAYQHCQPDHQQDGHDDRHQDDGEPDGEARQHLCNANQRGDGVVDLAAQVPATRATAAATTGTVKITSSVPIAA